MLFLLANWNNGLIHVAGTTTGGVVGPVGSPIYAVFGTDTATTDGSGHATFTYPTAFANGVIGVLVSNGDGAAFAGYLTLIGYTTTGFTVAAQLSSSSVATSAAIRANYIAIGS